MSAVYTVSDITTIQLNQIKPLQIHFSIIPKDEEGMIIEDMKRVGLDGIDSILIRRLSPLEIEQSKTRYPEAIYEVVDGHTRYRLAKELGWREIKARVIECAHDDALILNYRKNRARGMVDPLRTAILVSLLLKKGRSPLTIAELLSLPEPEVLELLKISCISKEILEKLLVKSERERKIIPKDTLLALTRTADENERTKLVEMMLNSVEKKINATLNDGPPQRSSEHISLNARFNPEGLYTAEECPGCGTRLRVYWLKRRVEWL